MLKRRSGSAFDLEGDRRMSVTGGEAEVGLRVRQVSFCRVGPGNFTPSPSQNRTGHSRVIRLVPPHEGCRLPLIIGLLPLPVDPSQWR
jgi:hypothetical protein